MLIDNTYSKYNDVKYIVGVCAHINTEWKLDILLRQLKELRQDGLDVCLSMNSREYLNEISPWVKYLIVDDYNELTTQEFYLQNADIMHNEEGAVVFWFHGDNWTLNYRIPFAGHSLPAFRLWRNSFQMAHANGYRWTIHIEYDTPRPLVGWRTHFEAMIREMESVGAEAYYYLSDSGFLWGNMFAVNSDIATHPRITDPIPYQNNKNWVGRFGTAITEQVFINSLKAAYGDRLIQRALQEVHAATWGEQSLNPSETNAGRGMNSGEGEVIHIYPYKNGEEIGLLIAGIGNRDETIEDVSVTYDTNPIWFKDSVRLCNGCWFMDFLRSPTDLETTIRLNYSKQLNDIKQTYEEFYYTKDIENVYTYIMCASPVKN